MQRLLPTKITDMLKNYWLVAIRKLWKHKTHALINVLGLAIGLTSCLIIFLITHYELGFDRTHPDGARIYRIVTDAFNKDRKNTLGAVPGPLARTLRNEVTGCEAVSGFFTFRSKMVIPGQGTGEPKVVIPAQATGQASKEIDPPPPGDPSPSIFADSQYFRVFRYKWLAGNPATSLNDPYRVVLSAAAVKQYFGGITPQEAIGRAVIYEDSLRTYVSGVVENPDQPTDFAFRDFISFSTAQNSFLKGNFHMDNWGGIGSYSQAFVLLSKGERPAQVERQFPAFVRKYFLLRPGSTDSLRLQPLADLHFNAAYTDEYSRQAHLPTLYGLMGIAVFILLLAVINFVNLSTAQSLLRTKEVGIRKVLGSRRKDIVFQFLGETFLLTLAAVLLSLLITPTVLALLHRWLPPGLRMEVSGPTLLFLLGITIATSLLAGSYPAKVISALLPVLSLKGQATRELQPNRYLHRSLIVFQFTISLIFIICTVVVTRQLHFVLNTDLGFDKDAIVDFRAIGPSTQGAVLAQRLHSIAGIALVSRNETTPEAGFHSQTSFTWHGPEDHVVSAMGEDADTNYLRLFGIPLIAGRNFFANDSVNEYVVNETLAKQLGFQRPEDAIGQPVEPGMSHGPGGAKGTIVGVVRDFHANSLHQVIAPLFLDYYSRLGNISIRLGSRQPATVANILSQVEKTWHATYPNEKFSYTFFDDDIAGLYQKEQQMSGLIRLAMIIAISISCMGLLGLATFTAQRRQKEISIRKVLGASVSRLVGMLTIDFLLPVAMAIVIATPVGWYFMNKWLQDFAYRTTVPWWLFPCCGLAAVMIAMLTAGFQAARAAYRNPVKTLRMD